MTVVALSRQPAETPLAFTIGARVDLRVGALAGGVVRGRGDTEYGYSTLTRLLRNARMAWRERGVHAGLALSLPASVQPTLDAALLDEAAAEAGCTRPSFGFELDERQLVASGPALAEDLRARGWRVSLRADPACPIPFGTRARSLYCEVVFDLDAADPFLALDVRDPSPLGRRLLAAKEAGLILTAAVVRSSAQARALAIAGFNRGGGPFAEAGLR